MPLHIGNLTSQVSTGGGWSDDRLAELVELVVARLERDRRAAAALADVTELRPAAGPDAV